VVVGDGRRGSSELRAPDGELLQSLECDVVLMTCRCRSWTAIEATPRIVEATPASRVLHLVARGLPNKRIARELQISEKTVKAHLTQIFQRIGVTDRTQAALWAKERGLA